MKLNWHSIQFAVLCQLVQADWQFRSRPDLAPPRLNITIPATDDVEIGYLFLAPFAGLPETPTEQHGPRQAGPYIFRDDGDLIWSGYGIYSIWTTNFQAGTWNGNDILFSFEGDHNPGYGHGRYTPAYLLHGCRTISVQAFEDVESLVASQIVYLSDCKLTLRLRSWAHHLPGSKLRDHSGAASRQSQAS
jgi:hypothetical protein